MRDEEQTEKQRDGIDRGLESTILAGPAQSEVAVGFAGSKPANVALIWTSRAWRDGRKENPVRGRLRGPSAHRKGAEFTKGWLEVQSP